MKNRPPNLLFLYTDEQAFNTLKTYGNARIEMPHLNRLAEESTVFDQTYVTQPVCTPSRSALLTGLYPHTNGCTNNKISLRPESQCLPEMLANGDYVCAHFGKWHLGDELFPQHGFEEWVSIEDGYDANYSAGRDPNTRSSYHHFLIKSGYTPKKGKTSFSRAEAARLPEEYGKPSFLADESCRFIQKHKDRPFVLYVNFLEPHMPFFGPRDNQYDPSEIPLPANFDSRLDDSNPLKTRVFAQGYYETGRSGLPLKTREDWKRMIANYWGLCSLIDTHVGRILNTLDECDLKGNTIVVFTSDHGDMMGSHRLLAKCVMFEEAIRVPLMMRLPGQTKGRRVTGPVSQIDLVPTLLDLLGQPVPTHLHGKSLRELLEGEEKGSERNAFIEWNGSNTGVVGEATGTYKIPANLTETVSAEDLENAITDPVRTVITPEGWKLNYSPRGEHELYNLKDDPWETQNLIRHTPNSQIIEDLLSTIKDWQTRTSDNVIL